MEIPASSASVSRTVDHTAWRVIQTVIVLVLSAAFLLDAAWLVALLCLALALETAVPALAGINALYARVLRPAGLLRPDVRGDDAAPHQFALGLGAAVLALASASFLADAAPLGWMLAGLVALLAALDLLAEFSAGCHIYHHLARHGLVPGGRRDRYV